MDFPLPAAAMPFPNTPPPVTAAQTSPPLSALLETRAKALTGDPVIVGDVLALLGDRSIAGLLLILALPMALPVPLPGMSMPFGAAMVIVAVQMAMGRQHAWLPSFLLRRPLQRSVFDKLIERMATALRRMEHIVKPRGGKLLPSWIAYPVGVACLALALLVALPIPLSNTMPGVAIVLLSLGLLERDGVIVWAGIFVTMLCIAMVVLASNGLYDALLSWWRAHV